MVGRYAKNKVRAAGFGGVVDRTPRYLMQLESGLYIGQFVGWTHAFIHWRKLVDRERWFIVTTETAMRIAKRPFAPRYLKFEEPCAMREVPGNSVYPGRFNAQNKTNAQGAKRPPGKRGGGHP